MDTWTFVQRAPVTEERRCCEYERFKKRDLSKAMDTPEIAMYDGVWGDLHVEYDVFKKRFERARFWKGSQMTVIHAHTVRALFTLIECYC